MARPKLQVLQAPRALTLELFQAAVAAVDPQPLVARLIRYENDRLLIECPDGQSLHLPLPLRVLGAGKAAARMAAGCTQAAGEDRVRGAVIVNDGAGVALPTIAVHTAGHPLPDQRGVDATRHLLGLAAQPWSGGTLFLLSGGASSLLVASRPPVTLQDKIRTTQLLLDCGADITEINPVRKHLSLVKGGGLLRRLVCRTTTLAISDIVGDPVDLIGSGPTVADPSTFAQAWAVVQRYRLERLLPPSACEVLRRGCEGAIEETLKPHDPVASLGTASIIASNRLALEAAARAARARGWFPIVEPEPLQGDTTGAALSFADKLMHHARRRATKPVCVLAGGETTVRIRGPGRGGRNQEFALALVPVLAGKDIVVLSVGTDGIDGPTDAAGAIVDGSTLGQAGARGLDPAVALGNNDSYSFFDALGTLIKTGPTGTNVMDLKIALLGSGELPGP